MCHSHTFNNLYYENLLCGQLQSISVWGFSSKKENYLQSLLFYAFKNRNVAVSHMVCDEHAIYSIVFIHSKCRIFLLSSTSIYIKGKIKSGCIQKLDVPIVPITGKVSFDYF